MAGKRSRAQGRRPSAPEEIRRSLESFIRVCRKPVLLEAGCPPIPLSAGHFTLESSSRGCLLHAWGEQGNLARRILGIESETRARLDLRSRRFGQGEIHLSIIDAARRGSRLGRQADRLQFREQLRRLLEREFPSWAISHLSSSPDLEHSISPLFSRALLSLGSEVWAVIAASPKLDPASSDGILTFGLIWLDHVRRRERRRRVRGLKIFVPEGRARATANRLAFLNRDRFRAELFEFSRHGRLQRLDPRDYGNLSTELPPCLPQPEPSASLAACLRKIQQVPGVETTSRGKGLLSVSVRGLPFAQIGRNVMLAGLHERVPVRANQLDEVVRLAQELSHFRSAEAPDKQNPLYLRQPESWLESTVRSRLEELDSHLIPEPVYSQVPAIAGADRGIIDLLASDRSGRLVVIEFKASEDPHLPLQGLDYWMRVHWHLRTGDLARKGYFAGIELSPRRPRMILVSPAFDFHPTTEIILSYFSAEIEIEIERVGVSADWRRDFKVIFRKRGAERP